MLDDNWLAICQIDDIPVLGARLLRRANHSDIAIFRNAEDRVFAVLDRCPHKGGPLSQGIVHGERVSCPLHGWQIGLDDGCALDPDVGCAQTFAVQCDERTVYMLRSELSQPEAAENTQALAASGA
ncbi:nitrite reductase [Pandoraea thiooxydans]|uniref:Nitrite reductase n=2 Tax=Pandoraea thiooxydans TaxID=445709 RepID=A0A0G3ETR8_9BURK|nr:nitrite reductase small subunit NirD [Pandoraea thiooxydans]AKJ68757.1 nitrite reductase [Pandoraea thiooxydans]APR96205.1 nitrite reductase [Pandoraea thiooxydans]